MATDNQHEDISFENILTSFKKTLQNVFHKTDNIEQFIQKRGFPARVLRDIMAQNPLAVAIPKEYGGRGVKMKECLGMLDAASYESLPLSLTFGINNALFLQPVAKYGQDQIKKEVFHRFLTQQNMGGLMITEPDYGSDALNMQTYNEKNGSNYHIKGTKHWQGLTGLADYWLMTSRHKTKDGNMERDIDFFVVDDHQENQHIQVEELYHNMGLYPIPYGKNRVDIIVPEHHKLIPESTGLKLMMDLLHRSRYQFPAMGMGFIKRMLDEALTHTRNRIIGNSSLLSLDQVKHQVAKIQSAFTICSGMCARSAEHSGIENNLAGDGIEANTMKAYVTDLMQESAQILTQLKGANGYKAESVAIRGIVDSRPFQIFEGSNDMLYSQIAEMFSKLMVRKKTMNLAAFIKHHTLTQNVSDHFSSLLNFSIDTKLSQRKNVDLGKIISRVVSANFVANIGSKGFQPELVIHAIENIKQDVSSLASSFMFPNKLAPIEDYKNQSNWLAFC